MTEEDSVWANCLGWRYGLMSSKEGGLTRYGIHEIYIDKDGGVVTYTVEPVMLPLYDLDLENRPPKEVYVEILKTVLEDIERYDVMECEQSYDTEGKNNDVVT